MSVSEWNLPFIHPDLYPSTKVLTRWVYQTAMGCAIDVVALPRELCVMNTELNDATQDVTTQSFSTADNVEHVTEFSNTLPPSSFGEDNAQSIIKFMERPLIVYQQNSVAPSFSMWPWVEMIANGQVQAKIHNYRFIRGTINVRITVNCNAFTYGLYLVTVLYGDDSLSSQPATDNQICKAMNAEHYWIDLSCKDEVVIEIPFFHEFPYLHTNPTFYTTEHVRACKVNCYPIVTPTSANGATAPNVTMKAYCWVTNTELRILEPNDILETTELSNQVDFLKDRLLDWNLETHGKKPSFISRKGQPQSRSHYTYPERVGSPQSGPVSAPLSIMADSVKSAGNSIVKATNLAHTAITATKQIAELAGFSRPQATENSTGYYADVFGDTASTSGVYHARNLTMDPGSLVNGIHSVVADRGDELSLSKIMERESYLTTLSVPIDAAMTEFEIPVIPCYYHDVLTSNGGAQFTNMGFASAPFKYWRGSIDFHFRVVASNFHSGRLGVMWAPERFGSDSSISILNIASNTIFDIRAGNVHTVRVNWGRSHPYAVVTPVAESAMTAVTYEYCNGYLRVFTVDNALAPVPEATVKIIVTMTPGPDFELAVPDSTAFSFMNNFPVSNLATVVKPPLVFDAPIFEYVQGVVRYPTRKSIPQSAKIGSTLVEFNAQGKLDNNSMHFGDKVISFRALLKRMQYDFTVGPGLPSPVGNLNGLYFSIPPYGIPVGQQNVEGTDVNWTNSKMNLLKYLASAYAGIRGGTYAQIRPRRQRNASSGATQPQDNVPCTVIRADAAIFTRGVMTNSAAATPMGIFYSGYANGTCLNGSQTFDLQKIAPIVHIPYHSIRDFYYTDDYFEQGNLDDAFYKWAGAAAFLISPNEAVSFLGYDLWYATADDFDVLHYNGPEVVYFYTPTFETPAP